MLLSLSGTDRGDNRLIAVPVVLLFYSIYCFPPSPPFPVFLLLPFKRMMYYVPLKFQWPFSLSGSAQKSTELCIVFYFSSTQLQ